MQIITPELIEQMITAVSPYGPGGRRITVAEFQDIVKTLTSILMGAMVAGAIGLLGGAVAKRFTSEIGFEVKEIAGVYLPLRRKI